MANELSKNGSRELSRELSEEMVQKLVRGFTASIAATPTGIGGKPLLRLLKTGQWVFGQNDDVVQQGSEWAIDPDSIMHGWSCWSNYPGNAKNQLLGEIMAPAWESQPVQPADKDGFPFKAQRIFEAACLTGTDEGTQVLYKVASGGGVEACNFLMAAIIKRLLSDQRRWSVPIVQLETTTYQHPKWGPTLKPVFTVTGWGDRDGNRQDQPEALEPEEQAAAEKPPLPQRPGAAPRRQRPTGRV